MKPNPILLITSVLLCTLLFCNFADAQVESPFKLKLISGDMVPEKNVTAEKLDLLDKNLARVQGSALVILQFEEIPTAQRQAQLKKLGIQLQDYISGNAYSAIITGKLNAPLFLQQAIRAVVEFKPEYKMRPMLAKGIIPSWATKTPGAVDLWISFPRSLSAETVTSTLRAHHFDITSTLYKSYNILSLRVSQNRIKELAALPVVDYVQIAPKQDVPVNIRVIANTRSNVLRSLLPGRPGLRGTGVVIGVGDDSSPNYHIDFSGRMINRAASTNAGHGVHVMGIVGGGGIVQEEFTGHAPKSTLIAQVFSGVLANAPAYVQDYGMVITNNSYGNVEDDCETFGTYDLYSRILDKQSFQLPNLQHVFAAGNSGGYNCAPFLAGYSTVLGGYQTAKNVITVGNTYEIGTIAPSSSKGPVRDGRIKPEITTQGMFVISTWPTSTYSYGSGTSMATPAVSGGLALLYQRYRQLHGNANPKNGLMKALLINGATDIGRPGPDYVFGFGWMNLVRSLKMLEDNDVFNTSVPAGDSNIHIVSVPSGGTIAQLKAMLYWNDSAAAVFASHALVNDLDLEIIDPNGQVVLPQLLDTVPSGVNQPAVIGKDHINNIEQVVINNPVPGTYSLKVKGTTIPVGGSHEYFLVFDTIPVSTTLTYPIGREHFTYIDSATISWDSYGNPGNDFSLEYTLNNGGSWTAISPATIPATARQLSWQMPDVATSQARVRLTHNGTGIQQTSDTFTIINRPVIALSSVQCEGFIGINWRTISGATDYEVMILRGDEMQRVAITTDTTYNIGGLSKDSVYWFSVRARINGAEGLRAISLSRQPNTGTCIGNISNNDIKLDAITSPVSGRKFTATELSASTNVIIAIRNLDDIATTGDITASYQVNGGAVISETITAPNIAAGGILNHTFTSTVNFSAVGIYTFKVWINSAADSIHANDTLSRIVKQLDNPFIDLTTDFLDNMESASPQIYKSRQTGLTGLDRYDFFSNLSYGQLRTFVNTGIAYSGSKALTLDADFYYGSGVIDTLTGTFNLNGYNVAVEDLRLDFMFKQHGQLPHPANNVWIRGNDQQPWIPVYDLYANQADLGIFKRSKSIELSDALVANGQIFTSSAQIKWGQWGQQMVADNDGGAGYTFDDVRIYRATDDIQLLSIDTPVVAGCGLGATVPVKVIVRNSANSTITNIPVKFSVDNGPIITETISSIAGNATITYTFTATADLSVVGSHVVKTWVDLASDTYHDNDTSVVQVYNSPIINSFPYLQNFENGDGNWYSGGKKSSWEYGIPASNKVDRAASGIKAWKTGISGNYNENEVSYLYSPCFDLTGMTVPTLSLSLALDLEDCGASLCDAAYMEYSVDGKVWLRLGTNVTGTNWYNKNYSGNYVWSKESYTRWHVATVPLPVGHNRLRLRFVMQSDQFVNREGIAIDDIHVYDNLNGIYTGGPFTSSLVTQATVNGSSWVDFTDGGKLIASVNPNGQNLGSTDARAYIHTSAVRSWYGQYYHNRNIIIQPTNTTPTDSVSVRFYFLDTETEAMIAATGCVGCSKPSMAYDLGVSKYSNVTKSLENGSLTDNAGGSWQFILPAAAVKVPFDKGYYAEFKVKNFSEFWLNNGGPNGNQSLPVELTRFTARKQNNNIVLTEWATASEINTARFEIEVAKGNEDLNRNRFIKIGEVVSAGNSTTQQLYSFSDNENGKSGVRYYRLKMIDQDGKFTYSAVRPVVFDEEIKWQVFPNPSSGIFQLVYQLNAGEMMTVLVYDVNGKTIRSMNFTGNGFVQKSQIDLRGREFASGMYMLDARAGVKTQTFRLMKQ